MANAYSITWPTASVNALADDQFFTSGVPLVWNVPYIIATPNNKTQDLYTTMPAGNYRFLTLTCLVVSLATITFTIVGQDPYGTTVTETLTGPASMSTVTSANPYYKIFSITPNGNVADGVVQVGFASYGQTFVTQMDSWNKVNNYTMSYSNFVAASGEYPVLTPYFTTVPTFTSIGNQTVSNFGNVTFYEIPLPSVNNNIVVSVTPGGTIPTSYPFEAETTNSIAFSLINIPLLGLGTLVDFTSEGSFVQTIIQQGGKY